MFAIRVLTGKSELRDDWDFLSLLYMRGSSFTLIHVELDFAHVNRFQEHRGNLPERQG